jgi:hypothetical protein
MERPVAPRRIAVVLIAAAALAGCGDDKDDTAGNGASTPDESAEAAPQEVHAQDRQAVADIQNLLSAVEVCFIDQQDYTQCKQPPDAGDTGSARVESASKTGFVVVAESESGTEFRFTRVSSGKTERSCSAPAEGECRPDGRW